MKVSVCMITYGHQDYIVEAIEGVLMQECDFDIELIIANDCSPDNTDSIVQSILENHPRASWIKYVNHEKNLGMMPNFINTLQQCKGKYIALCEGDDYWTDAHKLQNQIQFLDNNPTFTGCFHNVIVKNENNPGLKSKPWRVYNKEIFELIDTFSKTSLLHTSSFVFRRDALETPDWFNKVKSGDMSLFAIVASKGPLKLIPGNMGVYRKNETGYTTNLKVIEYHEGRIDMISFFKGHFDKLYEDRLNDLLNYHSAEIKKIGKSKIKRFINDIKHGWQ